MKPTRTLQEARALAAARRQWLMQEAARKADAEAVARWRRLPLLALWKALRAR